MAIPKRRLLLAAKLVLAAVVIWFALRELAGHWDQVRRVAGGLDPNWILVLISCAIVLGTYAMLAEAWRALLLGWGRHIRYIDAIRIWSVSSLGRYVPGKVWQMGTMAVMAQRDGISPVGAASSAVIITVISTLAGFAVVAAFGLHLLVVEAAGLAVLAITALGLVLAPRLVPWVVEQAGRVSGRQITIPSLPPRSLWFGLAISLLSWITYGIAFHLLARAVLGDPTGGLTAHIAIFTFSYLLGFLAIFAPGGLVVREVAMGAALVNAGMSEASAIVLVVVSRLWLTVLEITPALLFLAYDQLRRRSRNAAQESSL